MAVTPDQPIFISFLSIGVCVFGIDPRVFCHLYHGNRGNNIAYDRPHSSRLAV
jgi:hypothetical protein